MREKQKNRAKLLFCVIGIALMLLTTSVSMVKAETTQFGRTGTGGSGYAPGTNSMFGQTFYTTSWVDEIYHVTKGTAYFLASGSSNQSKMVILDWNRNIIGVSNAVTLNGDGAYYDFTFPTTITLYKSALNYTICIVNNGNTAAVGVDTGGTVYQVNDNSNSFSTPSSPEAISSTSSANQICAYLTVTSDISTTTTTPTATGTTDWTNANSVMSTVVSLILPLCFVLIPAFLGFKFAGAWGFFAGINMGVILCYCFGQIIPLWGVIVMLVVDGLLLFGRVGFRT